MASTLASAGSAEHWDLGDQTWSRDPATGAFDLVAWRELGAAPTSDPLDWAGLVGARLSRESADCGTRAFALFPQAFGFSPATGQPLPEAATTGLDAWLPPFGSDSVEVDRLQGLRLTPARLGLPPGTTPDAAPDDELPLPCEGRCQFIVAAFSTCESRLLALDVAHGRLHQWLPHSRQWTELRCIGERPLGASSLADDAWAMAAQDHRSSDRMFLPTDDGLAIVRVNLLAGHYDVHTVGHPCVGAPVLWQGRVHVPMLDRGGALGVHVLQPDEFELRRLPSPELDPAALRWVRPLADPQHIVWMGSRGQLLVRRSRDGSSEASLLPWSSGVTPRFDRGSPSLAAGHLWQPCFVRDAQGGRFVSVKLGAAEPEMRGDTATPPVADDEDDALDDTAPTRCVPLLTSVTTSTTLRACIEGARRVGDGFGTKDTFMTTFELAGTQTVAFFTARLSRPWATLAFVYAGRLYLHHPELQRLPGWKCGA